MPESEAKSHHVNSTINAHQSSWLTHWTGARLEPNRHDGLTLVNRSERDNHDFKKHLTGVKIASDDFGFSKGIKDVDLTMSLNNPGCQSFPFFKRGQEHRETKEIQTLEPQVSNEKVKYHMFFGESSHTTHVPENHFPKSEKSETPSMKTDPSTSSQRSPPFIEEQYKRMQKHIGMGFFPHQNTKSQAVHNEPFSFQNVEMTRMTGGIHSFSRTTHSLLITKQTDVKMYLESPPYFPQGQRGLKLQLLDSDHESHENVQKNESSADTDAMDMESFKENHLSGIHLSQPNKDIMESNLPLLPLPTLSTEKDTHKKRKIYELPDINLEITTLPTTSTSTDKPEPCTSRTQSLDMNTLQFNLDHTTNSKSDECSNSNPGSEPGNRWIKRLKLNGSTSLKRVDPLSLIGESNSVERKRDATLSHSWIQRWSHNQNQKIPEIVETGKLELVTDEFEKKQFPSIAAMALMGKAMTGFQQCKFQKKESFVVWNTKAFE